MLKYFIVILDDSAVSFCHYPQRTERNLMPLNVLRDAVRFAMLENLNVQFVWPDYELPEEYKKEISSIDHINIASLSLTKEADILVSDASKLSDCPENATVVAKISLEEMLENPSVLFPIFKNADRVNILITDVLNFHDSCIVRYEQSLIKVADAVFDELSSGHNLQVNLLTDRLSLKEMNNCNAGYESITLAPNGYFYLCPAFYYAGEKPCGTIKDGLEIKNPQLFLLENAPICRTCDAWQCRRCIWHSKIFTREVNTPGHEQCVMAHIERRVSRMLGKRIKSINEIFSLENIQELDYLDPFDKLINKH